MELADPQWKGKIGIAGAETDFQPIVTSVARSPRRRGGAAVARGRQGERRRATATPTTRRSPSQVNRGQVALGIINQYYWYREKAQVGESGLHSAIAYFAPQDAGYVIDVSGAGHLEVVEPPGRRPALRRLPDLDGGPGDHRPQRQLRVPDRVGGDDRASRRRRSTSCSRTASPSPSSAPGPRRSSCCRRPSCCDDGRRRLPVVAAAGAGCRPS